ncbi:MAG TPA: sortase [Rubrobacter sp.]|nr:sortase [Rubrobacter sp.]
MFRGVPLLMRVGVIMMALALALVAAAAVVSAALRSEPERLVPAEEVAAKSPGQAPRTSSGEGVSATEKSSGENEFSYYASAEEPLGQRKKEAKEPQAILQQQEAEPPDTLSAKPRPAGQQTPTGASQPLEHQPIRQERQVPISERKDWPEPTRGELESANRERRYDLLPGAIMGLTIEAMGIYDAPVFDSDGRWALANGVAHNPQTSLPWSPTPQRNVYLAGHRMGFRGTWSRMIFYNLHKLNRGDEVLLKDRAGTSYRYRVSEVLVVDPTDLWVMGQVRGRDMVTLQTCTPYPTFEKRLIVRADRV